MQDLQEQVSLMLINLFQTFSLHTELNHKHKNVHRFLITSAFLCDSGSFFMQLYISPQKNGISEIYRLRFEKVYALQSKPPPPPPHSHIPNGSNAHSAASRMQSINHLIQTRTRVWARGVSGAHACEAYAHESTENHMIYAGRNRVCDVLFACAKRNNRTACGGNKHTRVGNFNWSGLAFCDGWLAGWCLAQLGSFGFVARFVNVNNVS